MGRAECSFGDFDIPHCSPMTRFGHSTNVRVNGRGISRQGDFNTTHLCPGAPCPAHSAPITLGSFTVRVNGRGCGRIGDGVLGCTFVATGSTNVFAG